MSTDAYYRPLRRPRPYDGRSGRTGGLQPPLGARRVYGRGFGLSRARNVEDDVDVMVDSMVADVEAGCNAIFVYRTDEDLRARFREWPARGKAAGGFVGPHRVAAMAAQDMLDEDGIEVDLLFGPGERAGPCVPPAPFRPHPSADRFRLDTSNADPDAAITGIAVRRHESTEKPPS